MVINNARFVKCFAQRLYTVGSFAGAKDFFLIYNPSTPSNQKKNCWYRTSLNKLTEAWRPKPAKCLNIIIYVASSVVVRW